MIGEFEYYKKTYAKFFSTNGMHIHVKTESFVTKHLVLITIR